MGQDVFQSPDYFNLDELLTDEQKQLKYNMDYNVIIRN